MFERIDGTSRGEMSIIWRDRAASTVADDEGKPEHNGHRLSSDYWLLLVGRSYQELLAAAEAEDRRQTERRAQRGRAGNLIRPTAKNV